MAQAQQGDTVRVHYTGTLQDGSIFDSSETVEQDSCGCSCSSSGGCGTGSDCGCEPLEFTIGGGNVIPGFEKAVLGLSVGESIKVTIPADEAYGPRHEQMVAVVDRSELSGEIEPIEGQQLEVVLQDDSSMPVLITEVTETTVTLDANHPLAGQDLTFEIKLVEIV
ncbi:FKBP-type peptidyl-prolyl cis-trans isomerase [Trichlorobacter lovleyi]|uniref:Peptidyl-prolyl cis-trans isomerase n=1 Tax=Trichlorobacter lovleyi (strain ATCC BAA-1151 / DSM 17278 / SZ) TaxID=398767 RepID=B3E1P8_TRIL1|nr:FKBP-type peptidyl-prolyl cis-trans isomerase [Trichlorobacter lovleyi]ACD94140.1 peptidylprolyl isomerase FKBP-type [Trichlorobacter lovleyi SZ]